MRSRSYIALISMLALAALLFTGCQQSDSGYQVITKLNELPEAVRSWAEGYSKIFVGTSMSDNKYTYLLVSTGPVTDPKAKVNITDTKEEDGTLYVEVDLAEANYSRGQAGLDYSYPFALVRMDKTTLPIEFRSTVNEKVWIPQLVGVPDGWIPFNGPPGQVTYHEGHPQVVLGAKINTGPNNELPLIIEGIASIFEATVQQDWLADGKPYGQVYTMAATGPPDWGFFQFELDQHYTDDLTLRIYTSSFVDGSAENLVTVTASDT